MNKISFVLLFFWAWLTKLPSFISSLSLFIFFGIVSSRDCSSIIRSFHTVGIPHRYGMMEKSILCMTSHMQNVLNVILPSANEHPGIHP